MRTAHNPYIRFCLTVVILLSPILAIPRLVYADDLGRAPLPNDPPRVTISVQGDINVLDADLRNVTLESGVPTGEIILRNQHPLWYVVSMKFAASGSKLRPWVLLPPCRVRFRVSTLSADYDCSKSTASLGRMPFRQGEEVVLFADGIGVDAVTQEKLAVIYGAEVFWRLVLKDALPLEVGTALGDIAVKAADWDMQALGKNLPIFTLYKIGKALKDDNLMQVVSEVVEALRSSAFRGFLQTQLGVSAASLSTSLTIIDVGLRIEKVLELPLLFGIEGVTSVGKPFGTVRLLPSVSGTAGSAMLSKEQLQFRVAQMLGVTPNDVGLLSVDNDSTHQVVAFAHGVACNQYGAVGVGENPSGPNCLMLIRLATGGDAVVWGVRIADLIERFCVSAPRVIIQFPSTNMRYHYQKVYRYLGGLVLVDEGVSEIPQAAKSCSDIAPSTPGALAQATSSPTSSVSASAGKLELGEQKIIASELLGSPVSWSPDGKTLAWLTGPATYPDDFEAYARLSVSLRVAPADGSAPPTTIGTGPYLIEGFVHYVPWLLRPVWSPDGQWLAVTRYGKDAYNGEIELIRRDGSQRRRLKATEITGAPSWSPDGKRIVATGSEPGRPIAVLFDVASSARDLSVFRLPPLEAAFGPLWQPRDDKIIYTALAGLTGVDKVMSWRLLILDTIDANPRTLVAGQSQRLGGALALVWSPKGDHVAYAVNDVGDNYVPAQRLFADTGGHESLFAKQIGITRTETVPSKPPSKLGLLRTASGVVSWSADGTKLAFDRASPSDGSDIFITDIDGSSETKLTNNGKSRAPQLSPDGELIAAAVDGQGGLPHTLVVWQLVTYALGSTAAQSSSTPKITPTAAPQPTFTPARPPATPTLVPTRPPAVAGPDTPVAAARVFIQALADGDIKSASQLMPESDQRTFGAALPAISASLRGCSQNQVDATGGPVTGRTYSVVTLRFAPPCGNYGKFYDAFPSDYQPALEAWAPIDRFRNQPLAACILYVTGSFGVWKTPGGPACYPPGTAFF
ncbi:MAG: PD40 domain-containing protein [Chloroflexi bacterium]|nr:PD40 domain-containing protein [Chloroflexota bacterium]